MKKVGIMTLYYKTYNYGAQLQAYALQKAVEYLGYECEQICYKWYNSHIEQFYSQQKDSTDKFREFAYSIPHSKRIYSPENIYESNEEYDIFITGSDQVWGVVDSMPYYLLPHMALSFATEDKIKFSYAASIGNAALTEDRKAPLKYWLNELDEVSIREQSALPVISEITEKSVTSVLDPVFLLEVRAWEKIADAPIGNEKYIFVYNILNNPELEKTAKDLSEKTSLPIKTVSYFYGVSAGPLEFVGLIRNAEYVISDSFHGTVFSIIFGKQFYTFPIDKVYSEYSKNIRITDLLSKFGLSDRFVEEEKRVDFSNIINYDKTKSLIEIERNKSLGFLRCSLSINKADNKINDYVRKNNKDYEIPFCSDYIQALCVVNEKELNGCKKLICKKDNNLDLINRLLWIEHTRYSIYVKLLKYQMYGCFIDDEPFVTSNVIIYGAGKIGRVIAECSQNIVKCFADRSKQINNCAGYPVYRFGSPELESVIKQAPDTTFIITPVWDYEDIMYNIRDSYPDIKIISAEKLVEKIWE